MKQLQHENSGNSFPIKRHFVGIKKLEANLQVSIISCDEVLLLKVRSKSRISDLAHR